MKDARLIRSSVRAVLTIAVTAVVASCGDEPYAPRIRHTPPPTLVHKWAYDAAAATAVDSLARLLAEGLDVPEAREALHKALRESPLAEHKVASPAFFSTPEGEIVLAAIAARTGVARGDVAGIVAAAPPMDIYVVVREHRRSWRSSQSIAVAPMVDDISPMPVYVRGGEHLTLPRGVALETPTVTILMLGPRESFHPRADADWPRLRTDVIEYDIVPPLNDECEEPTLRRGLRFPGPLRTECTGGDGGGGGGGQANNYLYGDTLQTRDIIDNNNPFEDNEFELKARDSNGVEYSPPLTCHDVDSEALVPIVGTRCNSEIMHEHAPTEVAFLDVWITETDGISGNDEFRVGVDCSPASQSCTPAAWRITSALSNRVSNTFYHTNGSGNSWECGPPSCTHWVRLAVRWFLP